ncbi:hypothetical protein [Xylanibacter brevis]|jgi:hypothetical protein|uniref:hypothetical protein n=1 Tax=Xylanibacter brevis TaxID=83231 RepID=UPI0006942D89|nr:hypothetical protein [Xylanibacter brevis]
MNQTFTGREARLHLASEVAQILRNHSQDEQLHWKGSTVDLMEALHIAFLTNTLTNDEGQYMSFTAIVQSACEVLHVRMPRNPYKYAAQGRQRQGFRNRPYMDRYLFLLDNNPHPLWQQIEKN